MQKQAGWVCSVTLFILPPEIGLDLVGVLYLKPHKNNIHGQNSLFSYMFHFVAIKSTLNVSQSVDTAHSNTGFNMYRCWLQSDL